MSALDEFQRLSLVQKICTELDNHGSVNDTNVAEFIIAVWKKKKHRSDPTAFQRSLAENGAEFDDDFAASLHALIDHMLPESEKKKKKKKKKGKSGDGGLGVGSSKDAKGAKAARAKRFPGLSLSNSAPLDVVDAEEAEAFAKKVAANGAAPSSSSGGTGTTTNSSGEKRRKDRPADEDLDDRRDRKRSKYSDGNRRDRDRSRSRERGRGRSDRDRDRGRSDRDRGRDGRDGDRRDDRRRDRDRGGGRYGDRDRDRERGGKNDRFNDRFSSRSNEKREVVINGIYDGRVTSLQHFGAFVRLKNVLPPPGADKLKQRVDRRTGEPTVEGLVHVSMIQKGRDKVDDVSKIIKRDQEVKVKVISMIKGQLGLSMRAVDQKTGVDLQPGGNASRAEMHERARGGGGRDQAHGHNPTAADSSEPNTNILDRRGPSKDDPPTANRRSQQVGDQDRWVLRQLRNAGVLSVTELPEYDEEEGGVLANLEETEEELDIEINDDEPAFLMGQTAQTVSLSPIKVVKNPDGSLQRAALTQSALAKERRELRDQAQKQMLDSVPMDLSRSWEDPMAAPSERYLAADVHGMGAGASSKNVPEWKKQTVGVNVSYGRVTNKTIKEQRESLPIFKLRNQLLKAIDENDVLVVIGETGSGKTTQMTQYLAEAGYTSRGRIGCTQPRRVAAVSVAKRVAEEYGCRLGQEVGYSIRFEDMTSPETVIKYMTDGMLLREALLDKDLNTYSVMILDEAHERTIHTDVLFGLLKACVKRRKGPRPLKLIVTSATLKAEKFSDYFYSCPIFTIPGRLFPVSVMYAKAPEPDYLDAALITVMQIHLAEPPGDILVFLTGKEEIDTSCEILYDRMKQLGKGAPPLLVLPVYSALPSEMQTRIFEPAPPGTRKCVVSTNIAEASLTIDGIYYVVDPGFVKQKVYNAKLGMDSLVVTPISQNSANQRAGRAGRTGPGKCFRLYTEPAYKTEMMESSVPEIQRTNLGNTVLTLKAMGINDLIGFDFMDPPPVQTLISAMESLYGLGALDDEGLLTRAGRKMAEFPLEPQQSKILIQSVDFGCSEEILTIVAMLSADNIWYRPKEKQALADQKRAKFFQPEGDHLTLLAVYQAWAKHKFSNMWCYENFIQHRAMRRAQDVRKQLVTIMDRYKLPIVSCGKHFDRVRRAICSGYFQHAAKKDPQEGYKTLLEGQPVFIHPSSALFNHQPSWIIYHHLVLTTKEYMREVISIEPKWLIELAPRIFKTADPTKLSRRKRKERIEPLYDRYAEPNSWRLSRRVRQGG